MTNVYIYCEGQTEESFIRELLYPYFIRIGIIAKPIICETKRTVRQKYKGGVQDYAKIKKELTMLCRQHPHEYITTMFDYYGLPENTPGLQMNDPDIFTRIHMIETEIDKDINQHNCRFHLTVHEFEGLLFSSPDSFHLVGDDMLVNRIRDIRETFQTPEHINNSPETAPSKRILHVFPSYKKIINGTSLAIDMGIGKIMTECSHFKKWIESISMLAEQPQQNI